MGWLFPYAPPDFPTWKDINVLSSSLIFTHVAGTQVQNFGPIQISSSKSVYIFQINIQVLYYETALGFLVNDGHVQNRLSLPPNSRAGFDISVFPQSNLYTNCKGNETCEYPIMRPLAADTYMTLWSGSSRLSAAPAANVIVHCALTMFYILTN